jgi:endonuclease/exonuclease/phosphatase family metal-dependent hydrolase
MQRLSIALVLLLQVTSASALSLVFGSFNIRYANNGDVERGNGWEQRAPVVAGLIRFHGFDVLGTQEGLLHQLQTLQPLLPGYAYVGCGRDDGKDRGEHVAIFYKSDKFRLLADGNFWLSETPEVPSKGWDAALPRICTWAKLQPTSGEGAFYVFNVHFDHVGVKARLESSRLILVKLKEIAGDEPVVLTGDFNVDQTTESYRGLVASGALVDAFETSPIRYALNGTANAFNPNGKTESRIDHVFYSRPFEPMRYGVLTDTYRAPVGQVVEETRSGQFPREIKFREYQARLPSDHFPVLVELKY